MSANILEREHRASWSRWYHSARWHKLRMFILQRDLFTCKICGTFLGDTSLLVCDHKDPHHGDPLKFWDETNLQTLCKGCHDTIKRREEQSTIHQRGVWH